MPFPHGYCILWNAQLLAAHITADAAIALAYYAIPLLIIGVRRRLQSLVGRRVLLCFALFIVACGTTHVMDIIVIYAPWYWLQGIVKIITAMLSVATAYQLLQLRAIFLRSAQ